ncbi:MAG: hypothetical protein ACI9G1_001291 [Pirellulaceae bacterium]|jgi:hypothetical protein
MEHPFGIINARLYVGYYVELVFVFGKGELVDQKYEGQPQAEVKLEGQKVTRGHVTNDWGLRLQWQVSRNGAVLATPAARADVSYEHPEKEPGEYEIVLQMWKYVNYKKNKEGEFTESKFIDISNKVTYTI